MCASCVAQGAVYVGGAVAGLQVMRVRARHRLDARLGRDRAAGGRAADGEDREDAGAGPGEDGAPDGREHDPGMTRAAPG